MIAALAALALLVAPGDFVEPPPFAELTQPATVLAPAERLDPPPPLPVETTTPDPPPGSSTSAGGRCVGWEALLARYSPGWDVVRMSRIAYRESRCQPTARNRSSGSTGLLQLLVSHCRWLAGELGEACNASRLQDAEYNVRAAAALWTRQGYQAWAV